MPPIQILILCAFIAVNAIIRVALRKTNQVQDGMKSNSLLKSVSVPLTSHEDVQYYINIAFGSSPQYFNVLFDTGSGLLWVPSKSCTNKTFGCWYHRKYDSSRSKTYENSGEAFQYNYVIGNVKGVFTFDTLRIAGLDEIRNQLFGTIIEDSGMPYFQFRCDGIVGMAPRNSSKFILTSMYKQQRIARQVFSIYMNRNGNSIEDGYVFFGGSDRNYFRNPLRYRPIIVDHHELWKLKLSRVEIGNYIVSSKGATVFLDSGSSLIVTTSYNFGVLRKIIGIPDNEIVFKCGDYCRLPRITFVFGDLMISLNGNDYTFNDPQDRSICSLAIAELNSTDYDRTWILGMPFFRRYYTEFDFDDMRVGFAESVPR